MNKDSEAIKSLLAWLLQDPNSTISEPSGNFSQETGLDEFGATDPQLNNLDPLDSEQVSILLNRLDESNHFSFVERLSLEFGEIPAVEDRFQALLKRRLRVEIERNPPLFPWEAGVYDYESEMTDWITAELVPWKFWAAHLQNLNLPIPLPETLLARLLDQCQATVQSSLREGARLVQVVEALFPGQTQALNQLAGLVLASPSRSGVASPANPARLAAGFPSHYEAATPAQQMALSLLAAREIIDSLTLTVSPGQTRTQRQWLTAAGSLTLETEYQPQMGQRLRIQGQLPCQGSLRFQGQEAEATAQRSNSGYLSVELSDLKPNQTYPLEIRLEAMERSQMFFAVRPVAES